MRYNLFLSAVICATFGLAAQAQDFEIETYAADVRGWQVDALSDDQGFFACAGMSGEQKDGYLAVMQTRDGWMLRVPTEQTESFEGALVTIDGREIDSQIGFFPEGAGHIALADQAVDWIAQGSRLKVAVNNDLTTNWVLSGSAAMVTKVTECYKRKGVVKTAAPAKPKPPKKVAPKVVENDALRSGQDCPEIGSVASYASDTASNIQFYNASDVAITLYWLDFDGNPVEYAALLPGEDYVVDTWAEHFWLARDFEGTCRGGVIQPAGGQHVWEIN